MKQPQDGKTPTWNIRIGRPDTPHECCREGASGSRWGTAGVEGCQPLTLITPLPNAALVSSKREHVDVVRVLWGEMSAQHARGVQNQTPISCSLGVGTRGKLAPASLEKFSRYWDLTAGGGILLPSVLENVLTSWTFVFLFFLRIQFLLVIVLVNHLSLRFVLRQISWGWWNCMWWEWTYVLWLTGYCWLSL